MTDHLALDSPAGELSENITIGCRDLFLFKGFRVSREDFTAKEVGALEERHGVVAFKETRPRESREQNARWKREQLYRTPGP